MSRSPVGLSIPPNEYDEEFVVASIISFISNLEVIDNVILIELANQNLAPCQLIKKRANYKRAIINTSKPELNQHSLRNSASGQLKTLEPNQLCSNHSANRSAYRSANLTLEINSKQNLSNPFKNSTNFLNFHKKEQT